MLDTAVCANVTKRGSYKKELRLILSKQAQIMNHSGLYSHPSGFLDNAGDVFAAPSPHSPKSHRALTPRGVSGVSCSHYSYQSCLKAYLMCNAVHDHEISKSECSCSTGCIQSSNQHGAQSESTRSPVSHTWLIAI